MSLRTGRGSASVRLRSGEAKVGLDTHPDLEGLPREQPLSVELNGRHVARLFCTPDAPKELAIGWALAHGFLKEPRQLHRVTAHADRVSIMVEVVDTMPGRRDEWSCLVDTGFEACPRRVPQEREAITGLNNEKLTGEWTVLHSRFLAVSERAFARFREDNGDDGFHHAGVGDERMIWCIARDVRRQNAVDKVVGWAFLEEAPRERMMLFLSGRVDATIVFRAWQAGIPVVTSSGVPTREAASMAEERGVTLVGRALEPRLTVYSQAWRLRDGDGMAHA